MYHYEESLCVRMLDGALGDSEEVARLFRGSCVSEEADLCCGMYSLSTVRLQE